MSNNSYNSGMQLLWNLKSDKLMLEREMYEREDYDAGKQDENR